MERTVIEKIMDQRMYDKESSRILFKDIGTGKKKKVVDIKKAYLVMDFVIVIFVLIQIKPFLKR